MVLLSNESMIIYCYYFRQNANENMIIYCFYFHSNLMLVLSKESKIKYWSYFHQNLMLVSKHSQYETTRQHQTLNFCIQSQIINF